MRIDPFLARVGDRIRKARWALGLTQEDAADKLDMAPRYYQRLEAGMVNATLKTLLAVGHVLRRNVAELVDVEAKRKGPTLDEVTPKPPPRGRKPKSRRR